MDGGSIYGYATTSSGYSASPNGGAGGNGVAYNSSGEIKNPAPGGAGNPGGTSIGTTGQVAQTGTGGLLILYSTTLSNNGTISSNGSLGGNIDGFCGGSSGGGSINIFTKNNITNAGTITAQGGTWASWTANGGNGSVTRTQISPKDTSNTIAILDMYKNSILYEIEQKDKDGTILYEYVKNILEKYGTVIYDNDENIIGVKTRCGEILLKDIYSGNVVKLYMSGYRVVYNNTYGFYEGEEGSLIPDNSHKANTVANSYIEIDLSSYDKSINYDISIEAQVSSESGYDYGYATINTDTSAPQYNETSGRFVYISGNVENQKYTTTVAGGNKYYLHIGYRKDGSSDVGDDRVIFKNLSVVQN